MRVFVNQSVPQSPLWTQATQMLPLWKEGSGPLRLARVLGNVAATARRASAKDVVIFADDHPLSANLYSLWCRGARRPTLIRTDPYFHKPQTMMRRRYVQAIVERVDCFIVWAEATAERYHRVLGIPRAKLVAVPYHHTFQDQRNLTVSTGDYVFSGGDSMRDYPTLFKALEGLSIPVRIATRWQPPPGVSVPGNVRLGPTSHQEFIALLAGARLVVLPLLTESLRTSGQQSYLNAMALGKAVIVTDTEDAAFYIDNHRTGLLTPSGHPQELRQAILSLWDNPEQATALGNEARAGALPLNQENTYRRVLDVALQVHQQRLAAQPPTS